MNLDETIQEFLIESRENLDALERGFVELETKPSDKEIIASIFRTMHTLKGTAGLLGFARLEHLAHAGESLLSNVRDGTQALTPEITSVLLAVVDRVRGVLGIVESTASDGTERHEDLVAALHALRSGAGAGAGSAAVAAASVRPAATSAPEPAAVPVAAPPRQPSAAPATPIPTPSVEATSTPPPAAQAALNSPPPAGVASSVSPSASIEAAPAPTSAVEASASPPPGSSAKPAAPTADAHPSTADLNVRVDVHLLDKLMNLVGELVLARNQLVQYGARNEDPAFTSASQRLSQITTELQEQVMKTRMQPIGTIWSKLPRVVRDLAVSLGRQIRIEMAGAETELDRTILEAIKDPLTHIVRNSVDHGIEDPPVRLAAGKPRTGTLSLRAFHEGGSVNIEISDDGAGLKLDAIRKKALDRGVITADRAMRMSDNELMQLIFMPGFSTAEKISNVSGRGVGMDVVKTNIEKIGGTVDLSSRPGAGTTIRIRIPLTLAIIPALVIESGGQRYAIPQVNLLELVGLDADEAKTAIESIRGSAFFRLRGRLLPLVFLDELFNPPPVPPPSLTGLPRAATGLPKPAGRQFAGAANIVVLQADEHQFGLVVDDVQDTEEIVVKPLGKELKGVAIFEGATIMGDGRVALILDVAGLAQHAAAFDPRRGSGQAAAAETDKDADEAERQSLLLFSVGEDETMGIPLSRVARIEEFPRSKIERAGRRPVAQYRGAILPLVELSPALYNTATATDGANVHVIVYSGRERAIGFIVNKILDVVEESYTVDRSTARSSVLGAAVVQGKVIEILDADDVLRMHAPTLLPQGAS